MKGIEYRFVPADKLSEILPELSSGLNSYVGLERIANFASRAKYRRSLGKHA